MKKNFKVTTKVPPIQDLSESDSILNLYDTENSDIGFFNLIDDELIRLGGSKAYLYKFLRDENSHDDVYMESRNKPISTEPVIVYCHYDPSKLEENLSEFGLELNNEQTFTFNKSYIERRLERPLISGDIIKPFFQNQKYEIFEVQEDSFQVYGVYHLVCSARLLRDVEEVVDTPMTDVVDRVGGYAGGTRNA